MTYIDPYAPYRHYWPPVPPPYVPPPAPPYPYQPYYPYPYRWPIRWSDNTGPHYGPEVKDYRVLCRPV